jgi:pimeloyl-ACP methyl ester carboxylesterase
MLLVIISCLLVTTTVAWPPVYPECPDDLTCGKLTPRDLPGMVYDCAYSHPPQGVDVLGNVYYMHGDDGMRSKAMYRQTMLALATKGFTGLTCDQRGYSPGASPNVYSEYGYNELASDILSLTNAAGFNSSFDGKFHIVAHDQGARVAWHSIALKLTDDLLLSFTSLAIPHADVFSNNVVGPNPNADDQTAEQYLRQIVRNFSIFCPILFVLLTFDTSLISSIFG